MSDSYEKQVADLRAELAESKFANEALKEKVLAEQQTEFQTKIEALQTTIEEAGFDAEEAVATVEDFNHLDDDTFAKIVATMKKKAQFPPKKEDKKEDEVKEEKAVMKKKAELEEEVDTAEASEEVLENAEEPVEVAVAEAMGEEDPVTRLLRIRLRLRVKFLWGFC